MRQYGVMALALLAATACGGKSGSVPADAADRPAVVKAPPVILPSDTAKPDTMPEHLRKEQDVKREVAEAHGFIGAMIVMGDRRMLVANYAADATVRIADSTYSGAQAIANGLVALGRRSGIKEIIRQPLKVHLGAAEVVDSGQYGILSLRDGGPNRREEHGTYVTIWHKGPGGQQPWVVFRDDVKPGKVTTAPAEKAADKAAAPKPTKKG